MHLLSATYFGPIQWYQKINRYECIIEQYDNFVKQTYRNRCVIATANGLQNLTIPIANGSSSKSLMRNVRISDHDNWRHLHWNALQSAYGESPFFEYYQDDIRPFFEKKWDYLLDFNMEIVDTMCHLLEIEPRYRLSETFLPIQKTTETTPHHDLREVIRPKQPGIDKDFEAKPYYQVYRHKYPFQENLSILDLLFNEGNEAPLYL